MHRVAIAFVCAAGLALPAAADAQSTAPPGNAGIDEYVETVPAAGGNRTPRERGANGTGGPSALPADARRALEAQGADGRALAEAIDTTGPPARRRPGAATGSGDAGTAVPARPDSSESPLSAIVDATSGGAPGGLGSLLPIILAATLALMAAAAFARRRAAR